MFSASAWLGIFVAMAVLAVSMVFVLSERTALTVGAAGMSSISMVLAHFLQKSVLLSEGKGMVGIQNKSRMVKTNN